MKDKIEEVKRERGGREEKRKRAKRHIWKDSNFLACNYLLLGFDATLFHISYFQKVSGDGRQLFHIFIYSHIYSYIYNERKK